MIRYHGSEVGVLRRVRRCRLARERDRAHGERETSHDDRRDDQACSHCLSFSDGVPAAAILPHREDGRNAQKGSEDAASEAASRIGCTTKNEPTVTATAAPIATLSAESRGGEPPAGASRSSAPERMYSQRTTFR